MTCNTTKIVSSPVCNQFRLGYFSNSLILVFGKVISLFRFLQQSVTLLVAMITLLIFNIEWIWVLFWTLSFLYRLQILLAWACYRVCLILSDRTTSLWHEQSHIIFPDRVSIISIYLLEIWATIWALKRFHISCHVRCDILQILVRVKFRIKLKVRCIHCFRRVLFIQLHLRPFLICKIRWSAMNRLNCLIFIQGSLIKFMWRVTHVLWNIRLIILCWWFQFFLQFWCRVVLSLKLDLFFRRKCSVQRG